jgi:hypothetical protein
MKRLINRLFTKEENIDLLLFLQSHTLTLTLRFDSEKMKTNPTTDIKVRLLILLAPN